MSCQDSATKGAAPGPARAAAVLPRYRFRAAFPNVSARIDWRSGSRWDPIGCAHPHTQNRFTTCGPCATDEADPLKCELAEPGIEEATAWPFDIYMPNDCDSIHREDEAARRRRYNLELGIDKILAERLTLGSGRECDPTPTLAGPNSVAESLTPSGAVPMTAGLAALIRGRVNEAGNAFGQFIVPDVAVPAMLEHGHIQPGAAGYVGPLGWTVSIGPGFPNVAPDGTPADPGTAWIYAFGFADYAIGLPEDLLSRVPNEATDPDAVGPDTLPESWDLLRQNRRLDITELLAIVRLDPCGVFAAQVKTSCGDCC